MNRKPSWLDDTSIIDVLSINPELWPAMRRFLGCLSPLVRTSTHLRIRGKSRVDTRWASENRRIVEEHSEKVNGGRLVFDEIENAVDSLTVAAEFVRRKSKMKWKWVAIATHHALYSFCVATLAVRSPALVIVPKGKRDKLNEDELANVNRWIKSGEEVDLSDKERRFLQPNVISFKTALNRVQDGTVYMAQFVEARPVRLSHAQSKNLEWLANEARNAVVHFSPSQLILEIPMLKQACRDALSVIEFLVFESNMLWDEKDTWKPSVTLALQQFRAELGLD